MNGERLFLDTNILVYAYDTSAGPKHQCAKSIVQDLWRTGRGSVSTQVLQEFAYTVTRRIPKPLDARAAAEIVTDLLRWEVITNTGTSIIEALSLQSKHKLSFWDALIITAAQQSGATTLMSEDLSHHQKIMGILVENPFVSFDR